MAEFFGNLNLSGVNGCFAGEYTLLMLREVVQWSLVVLHPSPLAASPSPPCLAGNVAKFSNTPY